MATYTTGPGSLSWRKVETGDLPLSKYGLMGTVVNNVLYVSGGMHDHLVFLTTILFWDPVQELWTKAGDLDVGRASHAAVAAPASLINCI